MEVFLKILGAILVFVGVILVYDARLLVKRFFSSGDQNGSSTVLKVVGFLGIVCGVLLLIFYL